MPENSPPTGPARVSFFLFAVTVVLLLTAGAQAQNPCAGPWSITHQPPASCPFYGQGPNNVTNKRLPSDVMSHLAANGNTIAQTVLGNPSSASVQWNTPGSDDAGVPFYYAAPGDPYFKSSGCNTTSFNQTLTFRAPNNAPFANAARPDLGYGGADANFRVWDQTSGIVFGAYQSSSSATPFKIGLSSATTVSAAISTNTPNYCGAAKNLFMDQDWGKPYGWLNGQGTEGSSGFAPMAGIVRSQETDPRANQSRFDPGPGLHQCVPGIVQGLSVQSGNHPLHQCHLDAAQRRPDFPRLYRRADCRHEPSGLAEDPHHCHVSLRRLHRDYRKLRRFGGIGFLHGIRPGLPDTDRWDPYRAIEWHEGLGRNDRSGLCLPVISRNFVRRIVRHKFLQIQSSVDGQHS